MLPALEKITTARSVETVWDALTTEMSDLGFDRLLYGMSRFCCGAFGGDPKDMLILSNHPQDYIEPFLSRNMYVNAPMVRWAMSNDGARSWSWIEDDAENRTIEEQQVIDFNVKMGVLAGYTVSFPSCHATTRAAIGLTARRGMSQAVAEISGHHFR